jgi:hypothetical protein
MKRFVWLTAIIAALAITSAAQQAKTSPTPNVILGDGETCHNPNGCTCAGTTTNPGCSCSISGGTGTPSCGLRVGGLLSSGLLVLVGIITGSGLTFVIMRGRVPSP